MKHIVGGGGEGGGGGGTHDICVIITHCVRKSICDSPLTFIQKRYLMLFTFYWLLFNVITFATKT